MPMPSVFTSDEDNRGIEMARVGKTAREIADELGKAITSIHSRARQTWKISLHTGRKPPQPKGPSGFRWTEEEIVILQRLAEVGKTASEIAEEMGLSDKAVFLKAWRMGIKVSRKTGRSPGHGTSEGARKSWLVSSRRKILSKKMKDYWANPAAREMQSQRSFLAWEAIRGEPAILEERSKIHREARCRPEVIEKLRKAQKEGSSIERVLWGILGGLGLEEGKDWEKHFPVGPYQFDVLLKREGERGLLIECNGSYWHSLDRVRRIDDSKRTYVGNYFADKYEVRTLWEHEFLAVNRVADTVRRWLGREETRPFDFSDVVVRKVESGEARDFLGRYHYLGGIGRGGICLGAFLADEMIGVAVFSHLTRSNIAGRLGGTFKTTRELSRFAVKPDRHVENFGSWFLSRAVKIQRCEEKEVDLLVSYADETYGHGGGLYRAAGWKEDGEVAPDYWYVDEGGFVTGKQSLYSHANRMKMTEAEFAEANGLVKVFGRRKLRFVLKK
jgi:AraC-like DNA-binding protein